MASVPHRRRQGRSGTEGLHDNLETLYACVGNELIGHRAPSGRSEPNFGTLADLLASVGENLTGG
jgi:hypothetical protein